MVPEAEFPILSTAKSLMIYLKPLMVDFKSVETVLKWQDVTKI